MAMKKLKMGTPAMGITLGLILAALGVLVMLIGFWKVLILVCLFGVGYFIGTIDNLGDFVREKANKIIPDKRAQPINLKEEIAREQAEIVAGMDEVGHVELRAGAGVLDHPRAGSVDIDEAAALNAAEMQHDALEALAYQ